MKHTKLTAILLAILSFNTFTQAQTTDPRVKKGIGLVLSGGGARGMAHVGVLKALDSAKLPISFITGTSMGSIVGAMYAAGYTANEIESLLRRTDWDHLLSNSMQMRSYSIEEKSEFRRYPFSLPIINGKPRLSTGLIEGQEIWLSFSEIFMDRFNISKIEELNIPFACIATDLTNGEPLVLDSGDLVTALRASMAIPGVFSAVDMGDKKLVDGGIIRNFPVSDIRRMGAGYVIGSDAATPGKAANDLKHPLDVFNQVMYFHEESLKPYEDSLCDILINHPVDHISGGSFKSIDEILEIGQRQGMSYYTVFKRMADSILLTEGTRTYRAAFPERETESFFVDSITVSGLKRTSKSFLESFIHIDPGQKLSCAQINKMIRDAYGTAFYHKITYRIIPQGKDHMQLDLRVEEAPLASVKGGIHYNRTTGMSLILNATTRNLFIRQSRDLLTVNFGDNLKFRAEHLQLIGKGSTRLAMTLEGYAESQSLTRYKAFEKDKLYNQDYGMIGLRFQSAGSRVMSIGLGIKYEWIGLNPILEGGEVLDVRNRQWYLYGIVNYNTLDKPYLANKGVSMQVEWGMVSRQRPAGMLKLTDGSTKALRELQYNFDNYFRIRFDMRAAHRLGRKAVLTHLVQAGILSSETATIFNDFLLGGMNQIVRNQVLFSGMQEATVSTTSYAGYQLGLRLDWFAGVYTNLTVNGMTYDFSKKNKTVSGSDWLFGYGGTIGYQTPIGPIECSLMYSHQTRKLASYINLGIPF